MVRYGIAGFGKHAVKRLMPGFALSQKSTVTALSRRNLTAAQESAREHNIPLAFSSTEEMCASDQVDAVFVASPDSLHLQDTLTALRHGKAVLCEKPLAMNSAECEQMVQTAKAVGLFLGVAHVMRFEESVRRVREIVGKDELGTLLHARVEFHYAVVGHPRAWIVDPSLACGGPMADVGIHCIDTLRYILQDEVIAVSTSAVSDEKSGPFEAAAVMTLEFSRGILGTVIVSSRAAYRTPLEILGTAGSLYARDALNVEYPITLVVTKDGIGEEEQVSNHLAYALQVDAFSDAVEGKAPFLIPGEEGWRNQLVLEAAYRSWKSGKTEPVRNL
jgi:predicted dehydrogenase